MTVFGFRIENFRATRGAFANTLAAFGFFTVGGVFCRHNASRYGYDPIPNYHYESSDDLPKSGFWRDIAIAHGG